jgi:phenylpyruvate tautomerase PptA (4-oxalocrotonate tautomerase family)
MPYFSVETNTSIDEPTTLEMMKKCSSFISELLGKPEQYIMVSIKYNMKGVC